MRALLHQIRAPRARVLNLLRHIGLINTLREILLLGRWTLERLGEEELLRLFVESFLIFV